MNIKIHTKDATHGYFGIRFGADNGSVEDYLTYSADIGVVVFFLFLYS